jgi:hypothetical protein
VWNFGGVSTTRTLPTGFPASAEILALHGHVLDIMELNHGVVHGEYICHKATGRVYFLEIAARVGGAFIDELVEKTSGVDLWREWARVEVAALGHLPYSPPPRRHDHGALLLCLASQEHPDLSDYNAPEVLWKLDKPHHAGLAVVSPQSSRVDELLERYSRRLTREFLAVAPPLLHAT